MTQGEEVRRIVQTEIPKGKVVTYGEISERVFGHRDAGPAVGQAIKAHEGVDGFPWWRVVNSNWVPSRGGQDKELRPEIVCFDPDGRVNRSYRFKLKDNSK